jgi:cell division protein ZapA (FtsZ GTPase activity inhibitor)
MEGQDTKNITVLIGGRPYPLKVKAGDEPTIRRIVKEVNEKINRFQLTYTNKDKQDCLAMALLTYAVDLHKSNQGAAPESHLSAKLTELDELLDNLVA